MEVMCWFSGPAPQMNVGRMRKVWLGNIIDLTSFFSFEYFVTAGVVVLFDRGPKLDIRPAPQTNVGGMREGLELSFLVMEVMCWFSGPAPQMNVGRMRKARVVVLGDGGHVLVLRSCATNERG
ncbi:hypothetical protein TNCV_1602511 [Trichonephila clavipes]|nr:hypothetical protein TNCV_1602511 [Trichonephila clavipes]